MDTPEKVNSRNPLPWYKDGLHFQCTGCGKCCTGGPGYVWINEQEMQAMADFLKLELSVFKRRYVRIRNQRYALVEKKTEDHPCIFLNQNRCEIYSVRPSQCRTFPWWKEHLNTEDSWTAAAQYCEGIHPQAPLVAFESIKESLDQQEKDEKLSPIGFH